ncbi:MAG: hypothetical protein AB7I79_14910 [Rhizobiaceae bacterium]
MVTKQLLVLIAFSALCLPAGAAETERYRLERTDDGYVRLDTVTGAMSVCQETSGQLVCRMAADERAAFEEEVGRLEARLGELEKRVAAIEESPVLKPGNLLPSDEQIDRSLETMEKFFRRFMEVMKDAEDESTRT